MMRIKKRSETMTFTVFCGVAILLLLISRNRNLHAESNVEDKSEAQIAYQAKETKMRDGKRENLGKQKADKKSAPRSKNPAASRIKESKVDTGFYRAVVENNLFRPLGWQRPNREPQYTLIGTMIGPKGKLAKAFVLEQRSNQYYTVSVGEKVGDATVKKIASNQVMLYKAGEMVEIQAESDQFLRSSGREDGERRSPSGESRSSRSSEARGDKQLNAREMKIRFQNASPEERKRMLEKFRKAEKSKKSKGGKTKKGDKEKKDDGKGWDDKGKGDGKAKVEYRGK